MATAPRPVVVLDLSDWARTLTRRERSDLWAMANMARTCLDRGRHDLALKATTGSRFTPRVLVEMLEAFPARSRWMKSDLWDLFNLALRKKREAMPSTEFWPERHTRRMAATTKVWPVEKPDTRKPARVRKGGVAW